MQVTDFLRYSY